MTQSTNSEGSTPSGSSSTPRMILKCSHRGCDKTFSTNSHLKRHSRNHAERKAYTCQYCLKKFARGDVWKRHEDTHVHPRSTRARVKPLVLVAEQDPGEQSVSAPGIYEDNSLESSQVTAPPLPDIDTAPDNLDGELPDDSIVPGLVELNPNTSLATTETARVDLDWEKWLQDVFADDNSTFAASLFNSFSPSTILPTFNHTETHPPRDLQAVDLHTSVTAFLPTVLPPLSPISARISLSSVQKSLEKFWLEVDREYPVIHRPTFQPSTASPLLNACIYTTGVSLSQDDQDIASELVPRLCSAVMSCPIATIEQQILVLTCALFLSKAGQGLTSDQQDQSHALISYALTIGRRLNIYSQRWYHKNGQLAFTLDAEWVKWKAEESLRRVSWAILIRDIEYGSFFSQLPSRATSPFRLLVQLPCNESLWNATTPEEWSNLHGDPVGPLAEALHRCLTSRSLHTSPNLNLGSFAQLTFVYGLCALAWDINKRDLLAFDLTKTTTTEVNLFLRKTFNALQDCSPQRSLHLTDGPSTIRIAAYLAALDLQVDCQDLQVAAGVNEIGTLQPVRPSDRIEAGRLIRDWAGSTCEPEFSNSIHMIVDTLAVGRCDTYNHAWALYLACLVMWTVYTNRKTDIWGTMHAEIEIADTSLGGQALIDWVRGHGAKPSRSLMELLSRHIVSILMNRCEVNIVNARKLVDRIACTW